MKTSIAKGLIAATTGALLLVSTAAFAANPRPQRGDVMGATPDTYSASWVTGVSQDSGVKGQSIAMTDFDYYSFRNWWDQNLSDVTKIRASFKAAAGTVNSGGSPRFSLQLDNGVNVFLDPAHCGDAVADGWVESDFTGDKTNCTIYDSLGGVYVSDASGTAWSKLDAAYPAAKVWFMFLIQDSTVGTNYVDRIMLDSSFFTKAPAGV